LESVRTFISLNISEPVKGKLALVQKDVMSVLSSYRVKWENPKKFHLTLRFLGELNSAEIKDLAKDLGKIKAGFEHIVYFSESVGFFPNAKYPNVVFVDLIEKGNFCAGLVEKIDKCIIEYGIKPDKPFVPHVTMGRFRRDRRQALTSEISVEVPKMEIVFESFLLMKSVLIQSGSEYEKIKSYKFKL
jgi:2'-5' RNA ligase